MRYAVRKSKLGLELKLKQVQCGIVWNIACALKESSQAANKWQYTKCALFKQRHFQNNSASKIAPIVAKKTEHFRSN